MITGTVQGASLITLAGTGIARNVMNPSHGMVVGVEEEGVEVALEGEEVVIEAEVVIGEGVGEEVEEVVVVEEVGVEGVEEEEGLVEKEPRTGCVGVGLIILLVTGIVTSVGSLRAVLGMAMLIWHLWGGSLRSQRWTTLSL